MFCTAVWQLLQAMRPEVQSVGLLPNSLTWDFQDDTPGKTSCSVQAAGCFELGKSGRGHILLSTDYTD